MVARKASLLESLHSKDSRIRKTAIIELGENGDMSDIPHLEWLLENSDASTAYFAKKAILSIKARYLKKKKASSCIEIPSDTDSSTLDEELNRIMKEVAETMNRPTRHSMHRPDMITAGSPVLRNGLRLRDSVKAGENDVIYMETDTSLLHLKFYLLAMIPVMFALMVAIKPDIVVSNPFFIFITTTVLYHVFSSMQATTE